MENESNAHVTFRDYLKVLFRRKRVMLAVFLAMNLTVLAGLQLKTPVYDSRVTMFIMATKQIDSQYYKSSGDTRPVNMALTHSEIVKSNPVIERVVQRLKLDELSPAYERKYASPLKALLLEMQDRAQQRKFAGLSESELQAVRFRRAVEALKKKIRVEPVRETDLFVLTVSDYDPVNAARIANAVSRSYCIFDLEQQLAELQQRYGDKHLFVLQLKDNIAKMESEMTGEKLSNIEAIGPASVKIIEQASVAIEPSGRSKKIVLLVSLVMSLVLGMVLAFVYEGFDTTVRSGQELESQLKLTLLGFVPARKTRAAEFCRYFSEVVVWLAWMAMALLFCRLIISPYAADASNPVVKFVYDHSNLAMGVSGMAYLPEPEGTDWRVPLAAVILAGFFYVLVWALKKFAVAISGKNLVNAGDESAYGHAYANLAEQILSALKNNGRKSVLLTSALSREGTTTVAVNLGRVLAARPGCRVLIIDANLRKPGLHRLFSLENGEGLTGILSGERSLKDSVIPIPAEGRDDTLAVLTAGKGSSRLFTLFDPEKMAQVIKQAEESFDVVLVDGPNLQSSKDSVVIATAVDGVIMVVSEGAPRREVLAHVLSLLERKKARLIGAILNNRMFSVPKFLYERA